MTLTTIPLAASLDPPALRVTVVATADWPQPATILGHADGPDARDVAAAAREHWELTGCQPEGLAGYTAAGEC